MSQQSEPQESPVGDYPEVETTIRSDEETAEAEGRQPAEPSPGASVPITNEPQTAATAPPVGTAPETPPPSPAEPAPAPKEEEPA